ncbi:hypothetical protein [Methanolobus sp. WCC5]|uniref:hypothetical protein n=1 Tax=Methanolobus sp. WCC5 TaxID=3125785 RepID=UPI003249F53D
MKYTDQFTQEQGDKPRGIPLTDSEGVELTPDTDAPAFYCLTAAGAETLKFYIDSDKIRYYSMVDINVTASASVTLAVALKWRVLGADKEKYAYSMALTGTQALQGMSTAYPLIEDVPPGTKAWIEVATGGAATVAVNVMGRYKV